MTGWGSDDPIFGPYEFVHTTYMWDIKLGKPDENCDELYTHEDMAYYDGVYYGDWSIFDEQVLEKSQFQISAFQLYKAKLPEKSCS